MTATWVNLIGLIFLMCIQPVGGMISDKVGRKPLLVFFGISGVIYTYVLFTYLPQTHSPILSFLLVAVAYVILTGYTSINALVKSELFPSHVRALGVGIGYALANSMFGGTAPVIYKALEKGGHVPWFIAYVTVCIAISLRYTCCSSRTSPRPTWTRKRAPPSSDRGATKDAAPQLRYRSSALGRRLVATQPGLQLLTVLASPLVDLGDGGRSPLTQRPEQPDAQRQRDHDGEQQRHDDRKICYHQLPHPVDRRCQHSDQHQPGNEVNHDVGDHPGGRTTS